MNKTFHLISCFLQEADHLGPNDVFEKRADEKVLYSQDNIMWVQDERRGVFHSSNINSTGKLIITNERLFFQPKFFSSGSSKILDIPMQSIIGTDYSFGLQNGLSRKLTIQHELNPQPLVFSSKTGDLKKANELLKRLL